MAAFKCKICGQTFRLYLPFRRHIARHKAKGERKK